MILLESWLRDWHAQPMPLFSDHTVDPIPLADRGDTHAALGVWEEAGAPAQGGLMEQAYLEQLNVAKLWDAIQDEDLEGVKEWEWRPDKSFFTKEQRAEVWEVMVEALPEELRGQYRSGGEGEQSVAKEIEEGGASSGSRPL